MAKPYSYIQTIVFMCLFRIFFVVEKQRLGLLFFCETELFGSAQLNKKYYYMYLFQFQIIAIS